ncbi:MAG: DUF4082 domain-containing protein [Actinomycetota bacterium]|nr:DUF4082 domain-containing protein [Actinomycetota bacterium]MDQ2956747.1 DUF4082 domain-containing protein [Actinomycetota bacterium]
MSVLALNYQRFAAGRTGSTRRRLALLVILALVAVLLELGWALPARATTGSSCGANINPVACENSKPGNPESQWQIDDAGDSTLQGFSTDTSVNVGGTMSFKIKSTSAYTIDFYRLGYYGGDGARKQNSTPITVSNPASQPTCLSDAATQNYDCGNWSVSASWTVPSTAVSGVYLAVLTRASTGGQSHIPFVVRDDSSHSDVIYQTSDLTWEAYNLYGGSDFYQGNQQLTETQARAFKISFNRPYITRGTASGRDFLFSNEYPMIRFMEQNGYDVSYQSGVDTDRYGSLLTNHKVFLSIGHDEYWSLPQRLNVEAARSAGVNMMFLSGNEVYWHVRYEPSIDGSNTAYRTIVDYKDTWENAPFDPSSEQTATFRDPRFAAAPGGSNPENGLTGTMYMVNTAASPITVTAAQGKLRIWRNTGLANMGGSSTALAPNTVGYESDEDIDNGFRPAGLIDMSTTTFQTDSYLQDFGTVVAPGTSTHHITLYRAASGALVFGAGTIQWAWGLDSDHDGIQSAADPRIQQATINLLADMSAQPSTLMAGMVAATKSADTQAPTTVITSPTAGTVVGNSTQVTVTGTSTDNGGGVVGGVEVSLDGGTTWHPATGTTSWSYTGIAHGAGAWNIQARASDDSGNLATPTSVGVTTSCPCTLFGNATPKQPDGGDTSAVELGVRFSSSQDGYISGVRFYKAAGNTGTHTGTLWTAGGAQLATGTFTSESSSGWQTLVFSAPVAITADTTYVASYFAPSGHYSADLNTFYYKDYSATPLSAQLTSGDGTKVNGVYSVGHGFPTSSFRASNYYVDVMFTGSTSVPPSVTGQTPAPSSSSIDPATKPTVTFSKAMNPTSIVFTLTDASGNAVPGTVSYDSTSKTATFTPNPALAAGTLYTATVNGSDTNGNPLPAPVTWNFRTAYAGQVGGACPCTIFSDLSSPAAEIPDPGSVELGVKFSSDADGIVTGVRFYKNADNTGVHTGSLWTAAGVQLATATFSNESASGWQTVTFSNPVTITAGTTYVASYHAPSGHYQATSGAFASSGVDNFPLHVPVGGSLYDYATGFPHTAATADYGVDVVFTVPASTVPTVTSSVPAPNATNVSVGSAISASFNTTLIGGTATVAVTGPNNTAVAGSTTNDTAQKTFTFTPSAPLTTGAQYTVTISGGRSLAGTPQSGPYSFTFTSRGNVNCPCGLFDANAAPVAPDAGDSSSVALGVKFIPNATGYITGVRFYKSAGNTGTHTGSLWSAGGARLATGTFTGETATGWQTLTFANPVPLTNGSTYVVSYYAPNGHYAADGHYFDSAVAADPLTGVGGNNGVYSYSGDIFPTSTYGNTNYWVDPIFNLGTVPDTTPPAIESVSPTNTASSLPTSTIATASFSKKVDGTSLVFTVKNGSGTAVAGTTTLDGTGTKATFTPTAALARGVTYTAAISASDTLGNAMTAPYSWTFTTMQPDPTAGVCPCSVWKDSSVPTVITAPDTSSVEVGTKFTSDWSGSITGVRYYKSAANTGQHVVSLWNTAGTQLATAIATGETVSGWQTVSFASPVAITANTTYIVSYHTSTGSYSYDSGAFATAGVDTPPLHVPVQGGSYIYGQGFPSGNSTANYWVDPVLSATAPAIQPSISAVAANGSGSTATVTWTTNVNTTSRVDYGTSASSLNLNATAAGSTTSHTVSLTGLTQNTRYYYRVTSVDGSGNSVTSPASPAAAATYVPASTPFTDTTDADFTNGTVASSYVASNGGGEVVLTPTATSEFSGTTLPTGWTSTANATGGKSTVSNGSVVISGSNLTTTTTTYSSGKSFEVQASLGQNQAIGWYTTSNSGTKIQFSVNSSNQLVATANDGIFGTASGVAATAWTYAPHKYRIEWNSGTVVFYVDDVQKYTHSFTSYYSNLRPLLADTVVGGTGGNDLSVDWLRVGPYTASGTYTSRLIDAGATVNWAGLSWDSTVPTGTTLVVKVRTGNSTTPGGTGWTAWVTVPATGGSVAASSRYAQYQLTLTSTGTRYVTPSVRSVTLNYSV